MTVLIPRRLTNIEFYNLPVLYLHGTKTRIQISRRWIYDNKLNADAIIYTGTTRTMLFTRAPGWINGKINSNKQNRSGNRYIGSSIRDSKIFHLASESGLYKLIRRAAKRTKKFRVDIEKTD